jgi:hypothetical protein
LKNEVKKNKKPTMKGEIKKERGEESSVDGSSPCVWT